jgi:hypothetical protein
MEARAAATPSSALAGAALWARERAWLAGWIVGSRALVFAATLALTSTERPRGHFSDAVLGRALGPLAAWDGRWYGEVAKHGYRLVPGEKSSAAFFPLFPGLLRSLHEAFGWQYLTAGLVASNVAFAVAIFALYELGTSLLPERQARRAAIYATVFPVGFVFSMLYAESVAFAAVLLAALFAQRGRWGAAAAFAAAAALARPGGVFVALPLAAAAVHQWPASRAASRAISVAAVAAAPLALVALPLYQWHATGDAFAWSHAQAAWGRSFALDGLWRAFANLPAAARVDAWVLRDAVLALVYAGLLVAARRSGVGRAWVAAAALIAFLPLMSGTVESAGRMGLIAPPLYWGLAALGGRRAADALLRAALAVLLAAGTLGLGFVNP